MTFNPGDRVRLTETSRPSYYRGTFGTVLERDQSEGDHEYWAVKLGNGTVMSFEPDELERVVEARVPQIGEVWGNSGLSSAYLVSRHPEASDGILLTNVKSGKHWTHQSITAASYAAASPGWRFLAPDLMTYYRGLL